jgi:hypothetical protein
LTAPAIIDITAGTRAAHLSGRPIAVGTRGNGA